jgi:DNA mismatch endonuclease, patch repair protein
LPSNQFLRYCGDLSERNLTNSPMPDVFTKTKRSEVMARIRGRGNKDTEIALARLLRQNKITGWRRHLPIFGKPDFTLSGHRLVIFVDGCFWHGCPKHSRRPESNQSYWQRKLTGNRLRDRLVTKKLRKQGWRVLRIWEHDLAKDASGCIRKIKSLLISQEVSLKKISGHATRPS